MLRQLTISLAVLATMAFANFKAPAAVQASRIGNFGIDVRPDGSATPVGFYNGQLAKGGDNGAVVATSRPNLELTIATPGLVGATIHGFELFLDAEDIQGGETFHLDLLKGTAGYVRILTLGYPGKQRVPVEAGPLGTHAATPYKNDLSANILLLSQPPGASSLPVTVPLADYAAGIAAGAFKLRVRMEQSKQSVRYNARIDGANLQVEYTAATRSGL